MHLVNRSTGPGPGSNATVQCRRSGVAVLPTASEPATSNCHAAGSSQRRTSGEAQAKGCPSGTACSLRLPAVVTTAGCNGLVLLQWAVEGGVVHGRCTVEIRSGAQITLQVLSGCRFSLKPEANHPMHTAPLI